MGDDTKVNEQATQEKPPPVVVKLEALDMKSEEPIQGKE